MGSALDGRFFMLGGDGMGLWVVIRMDGWGWVSGGGR